MDILFIEPPPANRFGNLRTLGSIGTLKTDMCWAPLDLMIIAGLLKKENISSKIFDANSIKASWDDVKKIVEEEKPKIVIFTTSTPTVYHDLKTADIVKEVSKDIFTAITSTHVNALPEEALQLNNNLDFAIPNDSEFTFLELIKNNFNPENILGLTYRKNGKIITNPPRPVCQNLDELGTPSHDLVPLNIYHDPFTRKKNMAITYTSRGCVNYPPCIMCSACFYDRVRYRSVANIIEEFRLLKSMGVKEIRFPFEAGFNNSKNAHELFDAMIKEKLDLKFTCNGRADCLSVDLLRKMKQAGCMAINVGCESTNPQTLEFIHKRVTTEQVRETVKNIKKAGMDVLVYFIYGLPFETIESMKGTLAFAKSINADMVTFGIAIPHPGTGFYKYLKSNGYLLTEDWNKFDPMLPPPYSYPNLSSEEIFAFARKSYQSYYIRPSFIFKRFMKFNLIEEFKNFIGFVNRYVKSSR